MATVDAFTTYEAVGNREDLSDVIFDITPIETPVVSLAAKTTSTARLHEWQTKSLAAADSDNITVEGSDAGTPAANVTARRSNNNQIFTKVIQVSHTQETVDKAGRASEVDMQVADKLMEIRRDLEARVCDNEATVVGNDTTPTGPEMAGLGGWVTTDSVGATGVSPVGGNGTAARTDGTQRPFLESQFKDVLQLVWTNGAKSDTVVLGAFNKQVFSGFSGNNTRFSNSDDARLVATIEVYRSDFGTLRILPDRFSRPRDAWILQSDMLAIADLIPANTFELAKIGISHRRMIELQTTLEVRQELAHGLVADLTVS